MHKQKSSAKKMHGIIIIPMNQKKNILPLTIYIKTNENDFLHIAYDE